MTEDIVTIARYDYPPEADMARIRLEAEGIESILSNAITSQMVVAPAILGGVLLQVRREDAEQAEAILSQEYAEPTMVISRGVSEEVRLDVPPEQAMELIRLAMNRNGKAGKADTTRLRIQGRIGGFWSGVRVWVQLCAVPRGTQVNISVDAGAMRGTVAYEAARKFKIAVLNEAENTPK